MIAIRGATSVEADTLPASQVFRARLLFAGDVMAHMPQVAAARRNGRYGRYDFSRQFEYVKPLFAAADRVIVNLETTLSPEGPYAGYPAFRTPDELAYALRDAGVDMAVLENNHCCDRGIRGIRSTLAALDDVGIRHTGAFIDTLRHGADHPLRFEAGGIRFALFSYTYGTNGLPVPAGATVNRIDTVMMARDLAAVDRADAGRLPAPVRRRPDCRKPPACDPTLRIRLHPCGVLFTRKFRLESAAPLLRRRFIGRRGGHQTDRAERGSAASAGVGALRRADDARVGGTARLPDSAARGRRHDCTLALRTCGI